MTITRALISDDGQTITWDVQRDGVSIGTSTEPSPAHPSITRMANETAMRQAPEPLRDAAHSAMATHCPG